MNLRNLRYFLMVAEEKNMTKAARKLFISQQTLSGVIRRLEEEYHTRLFEREPCMHLTEAGFYMEKFARQVLKMETTLTNQLDEISHELRGHLTIGITPTRARLLLPVFLPIFRCHYPQIELSFSVDGYTSLLEQLQDDNLDAMIATARPKNPGLQDWFLYTDPFSLVVPHTLAARYLPSLMPSHSSHPANLKIPFHQLPMEERRHFLASAPMIQMVRSTIQNNSDSIFHELGLTPYILYSFHDLETVLELSLSSLGCCFSFAQYAEKKARQHFQDQWDLWPYLLLFPEKSSKVVITTKKSARRRQSLQIFIEDMQQIDFFTVPTPALSLPDAGTDLLSGPPGPGR